MAQVCSLPALTAFHVPPPEIVAGVVLFPPPAFPSWPNKSLPQHRMVSSDLIPQPWLDPALNAFQVPPPDMAMGMLLCPVVLSMVLAPQHQSVSSVLIPQV